MWQDICIKENNWFYYSCYNQIFVRMGFQVKNMKMELAFDEKENQKICRFGKA